MTDEERIRWLRELAFEFEDDENTLKCVAAGIPDDHAIRASLALLEKYGHWGEADMSPEGIIEVVRTVLDPPALSWAASRWSPAS